jgi:hypothetical protein
MAISRTLFESGFQMVKNKMAAKFGGHFVKTIRKPDFLSGFRMVGPFESRSEVFLTSSLDRFGMNKIFFITVY